MSSILEGVERSAQRSSRDREPSACQKTKYRGKIGWVSGRREDLLLQRL